jgi:hypothetical protein
LLRVSYTLNSKCFDENINPEVKIIQESDGSKPLPEIDNLLVEFFTFLSDRKLKSGMELEKRKKYNNSQRSNNISSPTIQYVEKLLTVSLMDYLKYAISLMSTIFRKCTTFIRCGIFSRIKQWVLKCNEVKPLKPSIRDFDDIIRNAIKRAKDTGVKPLKYKDTLQYKNKELYRLLSSW